MVKKYIYWRFLCYPPLFWGHFSYSLKKITENLYITGPPNTENPKSLKIPPPPTRKCLHWERFSPPSRFCSSWAPGRGSLLQNYRNYVRLVAPETIHITVSFYALKWTLLPGIFRGLSTLLPLNIVRIWGLVKIFSIHFCTIKTFKL